MTSSVPTSWERRCFHVPLLRHVTTEISPKLTSGYFPEGNFGVEKTLKTYEYFDISTSIEISTINVDSTSTFPVFIGHRKALKNRRRIYRVSQ